MPNANAEIEIGTNPEVASLWMKAMGVDAIYIAVRRPKSPTRMA
ncbi:MAG: hypothetical protein WDO73_33270 [Ignavibacteriota bacterium]